MQHRLHCANCGRATMAAEAVIELELTCPWCLRVTIFNITNGQLTKRLMRGASPENLSGPAEHDAFERMMRQNRGVDTDKC